MTASIELVGVSKWYGEVLGLNGISAEIGPGVTGLLGPNGAGKTTLFRLLTGMARPSLGEVRIFGENVAGNPALFRRVGFCPEGEHFYEEMTGFQFVATLARFHGLSPREAEEAARKALERVQLSELGGRRLSEMSRGMRQRVKIAQALLHDPELLLLDEPLNGMDPVLRHRTIQEIRRLGESGKTVLVSSHILHEVEAMTNRIVLLVQGKMLAQGGIREIRSLLDKHPRKIVVRTPEPRRIAAEMLATEGVVGARIEGESDLLIEALRSEPVLRRLTEGAARGEFPVEEVFTADEDLESVFRMLVG